MLYFSHSSELLPTDFRYGRADETRVELEELRVAPAALRELTAMAATEPMTEGAPQHGLGRHVDASPGTTHGCELVLVAYGQNVDVRTRQENV